MGPSCSTFLRGRISPDTPERLISSEAHSLLVMSSTGLFGTAIFYSDPAGTVRAT